MTEQTKKTNLWHKLIPLSAAFLLLLLTLAVPLPDRLVLLENAPLTQSGRATLAVLCFCLVLWITEPMPFHITGLFGMILLAVLRTESFVNVVSQGFGNDTIVFFIGVLVLSSCIGQSGLGSRVSTLLLCLTGNSTKRILLGFLILGAFLAMWITNLAAAAVLTPLALSVAEHEGLRPGHSRFGKSLFIAVAWGALLGGPATPAGSGANPLLLGFVRDLLNIEVSFTDWMLFGVPVTLVMLLPTWVLLLAFFPPEMKTISRTREELKTEYKNLPPMSRNEKSSLCIFLLTILLWLVSEPLGNWACMRIPTSMPALLGACLCFFPGVTDIKWKKVQDDISWSGILLIASGVSLGLMMYTTGAAKWIAMLLLSNIGRLAPMLQVLCVIMMVSLLKLGLSSNTVTATVTVPILIALAMQQNIPPLAVIIPAAMTMNAAYILVTSTPTSVIPYTTGYFSISDMIRPGISMTVLSAAVLTPTIYLIGLLSEIY